MRTNLIYYSKLLQIQRSRVVQYSLPAKPYSLYKQRESCCTAWDAIAKGNKTTVNLAYNGIIDDEE